MKKKTVSDAPRVLVIDVGGTHIKFLATGEAKPREFNSGRKMTADEMTGGVLARTEDWNYDVIAVGFPGPVVRGRPVSDPPNLAKGWVGFDFEAAFERPVKIINDAAMQALGGYEGGRMLFLGLGTGLGSVMIIEGVIEAMELAHLPYKDGKTYEDFLGKRGLEKLGKKRWRHAVREVIGLFEAALRPDYTVLGGGNIHELKELPENVKLGENANAFAGGFRLWHQEAVA
ncbi:MAG: ROK family protein [Gammaproteobacteria bacterium]|nr:ROK family protein [Gammaproteobacteria bacterium]